MPRVYGLVNRVIGDRTLSEDAIQDVYLQIWSASHNYNPCLGSPLALVMTIAHRRAVDIVRSEQRSRHRIIKYSLQAEQPDHDPVAGLVDRLAAAESLGGCKHALTDLQRESIYLAYYDGLTGTEIAAALGVNVSTVKTRIRDGILRLRACLAEEHGQNQADR